MAGSKRPLPLVIALLPPSGDRPPTQLSLHASIVHSSIDATAVYIAFGIERHWSAAGQRIAGEWNACRPTAREAA
jgi:hypothetical protein